MCNFSTLQTSAHVQCVKTGDIDLAHLCVQNQHTLFSCVLLHGATPYISITTRCYTIHSYYYMVLYHIYLYYYTVLHHTSLLLHGCYTIIIISITTWCYTIIYLYYYTHIHQSLTLAHPPPFNKKKENPLPHPPPQPRPRSTFNLSSITNIMVTLKLIINFTKK